MELFFPGFIYGILQILTGNRSVGRDLYNVHSVDITEFFFFCKCCTGHTALLIIFIKEVLESNSCQSLALTAHIHMLLRLNCLMQAV